jgi:hypothetical protein
LQWYPFFPASLKVCEYLCPCLKRPESKDLTLFAVAVCAALSLLIHLTLVPRLMVMLAGLKRKSWITTVLVGCFALAVGCLCAPATDTAISVLATTSAATTINKIMRLISETSLSYFSRPTKRRFVHNRGTQLDAWSDYYQGAWKGYSTKFA